VCKRGWSQEKFSEICDVHRTWMGQIERGKNVSVNTLANIANGLGVTLSTLFAGVEGGATEEQAGNEKESDKMSAALVVRAGHQTVTCLSQS
jgi:transcriptional regulator with XRE-family HTH domain